MSNPSHKRACASCGSLDLYTTRTEANGPQSPMLLPKLGKFLKPAKFDLFLCSKCGHVSFFASEESLANLDRSGMGKWKSV